MGVKLTFAGRLEVCFATSRREYLDIVMLDDMFLVSSAFGIELLGSLLQRNFTSQFSVYSFQPVYLHLFSHCRRGVHLDFSQQYLILYIETCHLRNPSQFLSYCSFKIAFVVSEAEKGGIDA